MAILFTTAKRKMAVAKRFVLDVISKINRYIMGIVIIKMIQCLCVKYDRINTDINRLAVLYAMQKVKP